ncbi:MAG: VTT domain-containing protein [Candidatus Nezhaarchaeota archaeon]|nr:VTT domain-containing protein [Candidatus Nezhaarchaeota archaeon]
MFDIISAMVDLALKYSYLGVFIVSALSNLVLFFPVPYLAALLIIVTVTKMDPVLTAIASGLGSGIGKLFAYFVGYSGRKVIGKGTRAERLDALAKMLSKGGLIAVLIVSATPLPDDIVLVPMGLLRYSLWKFWAATTIGKTFLALLVCYFGVVTSAISEELGFNSWLTAGISIAVTAVGTYIVLKVNWVKIASTIALKGLNGVIQGLKDEGVKWFFT